MMTKMIDGTWASARAIGLPLLTITHHYAHLFILDTCVWSVVWVTTVHLLTWS